MSCTRNSRTLSRLGILWGLLSLATLLTAFVSNVWLFTREPVKLPNSEQSTTITFKIGLWRVCPSVNKTNISQNLPSPACSLVKYSSWDEIKHTDLGIWTTLNFTPPFLTRMRLSTLFEAASVVILILATVFALLGHCNRDQKTLVAVGLYIIGGLILGGGLLVFASVLSDAYLERPQKSDSIREILYSSFNENPYDYRYGWCFMAAGAAFIMAEIAAVFCVTGYLRRFPTMEDMVRVMVPGGERKLREHEGVVSEYLVTHRQESSYRRRQNGPQNLWGISKDLYGTKSETLAPNDQEGAEGPLLLSSSAPDVCSSNQTSNVKETPDTDVSAGGCTNAALAAITGVNPDAADVPPAQLLDIKTSLDYDSHLAGVTVPITLMRTQPLVPVQVTTTELETIVSPIPTPFLFAQRLQCFGNNTLPANASGQQGILSVSEGTTVTSYSTLDRAMAGSSHRNVNKFSTLQPQKKKGVTISTFSTMDTYDTPKFGTWNNSEV